MFFFCGEAEGGGRRRKCGDATFTAVCCLVVEVGDAFPFGDVAVPFFCSASLARCRCAGVEDDIDEADEKEDEGSRVDPLWSAEVRLLPLLAVECGGGVRLDRAGRASGTDRLRLFEASERPDAFDGALRLRHVSCGPGDPLAIVSPWSPLF